MLKLTSQDITLLQSAPDKLTAIDAIAADLTSKGFVAEGYIDGMINREKQNSTFLGNGIAIPHGTTDTRDLVKQTGITVHHFPQGVQWGDNNTVYVAIGIAAKSDEHLEILKQLTKVLSDEGIEECLRLAKTKDEIIAILNGQAQLNVDFDASLIQRLFPASDMIQMSAVAGGLLSNTGCAESEFVAELVTKKPTHLGKGLWLVSSDKAVKRTGISFVTTANDCNYQGEPVKGLIAIAACNHAHKNALNTIGQLVFSQQQETLLNADTPQLLTIFNSNEVDISAEGEPSSLPSDNTGIFKIKNVHGLHARPGAMLVAEAKRFESTIKVANLNGDSKPVNAKSLMKVIAMGVRHGHELQFTAEGADAPQAIEAIGQAISAGLGEG
ncbi:fused PTS fructose transporter subunit IIA/HPr protein [Vibrio genomosp. F6]|uniref:Multiphosphoryl transfer protein n=1 Tax=Vibrio genomosp. F6 str. FF-238 TaxID=1191298 RepID=A0A1E5D4L0_9VIBR|nr:fused PTS fructose transporter subunit IIA/HPr protein [Vibrio genomosp. F6]OEE78514.1 bifunctional PTS fructose transporter subunit IIA/HPr protein [Vibrio genomosp. F6 str. FF-238]